MDIVTRLKYFMDSENIAISQFADTCNIPRPTLSQLLSGRNKKVSNELIDKIHNAYPSLNIIWLLFNEGSMLDDSNIKISEAQNGESHNISHAPSSDNEPITAQQSILNNGFGSEATDKNKNEPDAAAGIEDPQNISSPKTGNEQDFIGTAQANTVRDEPQAEYYALPVIDFDVNRSPSDFASNTYSSTYNNNGERAQQNPFPNTDDSPSNIDEGMNNGSTKISIPTSSGKKIKNIVVFYSDNTFQSFMPTD